jgi:carboxyl-terminal processing protease
LFTLWLSIGLLAASVLAPAGHAQTTPALDDMRAEYHDLLDLFYRPLKPSDLLQPGWAAMGADASRRGAAAPPPLPDLPDDPDAAFDIFATAYTAYLNTVPQSFSPTTAAIDVENAMADSLHEQHTHYLSQAIMRAFLSTVGGGESSIGLGAKTGVQPAGLITEVAPGGPAANAGILPGDVVTSANGKDLSSANIATVSAALVGPNGSTINLTIDRGDGPRPVTVTLGPYYFPPLVSSMLPGGIGYLRLSDFVISGTTLPDGTELLSDLDRQLDDLDAQGAQGLILDLRNNGGGSVQTADEILGRFLPDTAPSVRESDERGHQTFELAAGRLHARQLPMAVLINGGSASASEVTAAALRDQHRAVLVGQKSAGAVASSELLPLPSGAGVQVAVAAATAPDSNTGLDGIGITPDVLTSQPRTLADYRSGDDPQLDAAVAALASAPAPPTDTPAPAAISQADLDQHLGGVLPAASDLATNDRFTTINQWQRLDYTHPNELIDQNGGSPDPLGLQQTLRARGYQGTVMATYGKTAGDLPALTVNADIYASDEGAHSALITNDLPYLQQPMDTPIQLGDETVAYSGSWLAEGSSLVSWRRGRVVYTVTYSDVPGNDRPNTLSSVAQLVDARAQQVNLPQ